MTTAKRAGGVALKAWFVRGIAIGCAAILPGCSGCSGNDEDAPAKKAGAPGPFSQYAIHVFVGSVGKELRLDLPPAKEPARAPIQAATTAGSGGSGATSATNKPLTTAEVGDAGVITLEDVAGADGFDAGWLLLLRAAAHCGATDVNAPWNTGRWYIFPGRFDNVTGKGLFSTCDQIYRHAEILLCTADALAEIGDSVVPIAWDALSDPVPSISPWFPAFTNQWTIPIQSERDKFIVRDVAFNVLGNLARLDFEVPNVAGWDPAESCADAYARSTTDPLVFDNLKLALYGAASGTPSEFEPKLDITFSNAPALASSRMGLDAHILRAGGRTLRDLIEKSVYADFAGAKAQRALAGDPARGAALMWGAETDATQPYNSLTHALRVLAGRWESYRPTTWDVLTQPENEARLPIDDPACGGHLAMELLVSGLDPGTSARWSDRMVRTTEQESAVGLIEKSGIVIPKMVLDQKQNNGSFSDVRDAVKSQLVFDAARDSGITDQGSPEFVAFRAEARAQSIEQAVDLLAEEDLRFALDRSFDAYRLMTGEPADAPSVAAPSALAAPVERVAAASTHSDLSALAGAVLASNQPKLDVGDVLARVGPAFAASRCRDYTPPGSETTSMDRSGKVGSFQNVFTTGATFRRRLSIIRERAKANSSLGGDLVTLADAASAELNAWAGPGYVYEWHAPSQPLIEAIILGLSPEDLGVSTYDAMRDQVVLVFGPPWVAECATHQRESCPENFWQNYVQQPQEAHHGWEQGDWANLTAGLKSSDGRLLYFAFPDSGPTNFAPVDTPQGTATQEFLYVISKGDPAEPNKGRVLAAFPYRASSDMQQAVMSNLQRELLNKVFRLDPTWMSKVPKLGRDPATDPSAYCVEGVPKDFFVPLENELTSDSDGYENSWKHYLDLADKSAAETDQICREIIDLGLQKDLRRESAGEELARICGSFTALDEIKFQSGKIVPSNTDAALNSCLAEKSWDVVFLSDDPYLGEDDQTKSDHVKQDYLQCQGIGATNPLCDPARVLTVDALGIPMGDDTTVAEDDACQVFYGAALASKFNSGIAATEKEFNGLSAAASAEELGMALGSLRIIVDDQLNWKAYSNSILIMSTTDNGYWPHCRTEVPACSLPPPLPQPLSGRLDKIFGQGITDMSPANRDLALQRVTGAMWTMGAIAGWIPAGRFELPVPAANFTALGPLANPEPGFVIFGAGEFHQASGGYVLTLTDTTITGDDQKKLGVLQPMSADFASGVRDDTLRPQWVRDLYGRAAAAVSGGAPERYLRVTAKNPALSFDHDHAYTDLPLPSDAKKWLASLAPLANGVRENGSVCENPSNDWMLVKRVGALKRSAARGILCSYNSIPLMGLTYEPQNTSSWSLDPNRVGFLADLAYTSSPQCDKCCPNLPQLIPGLYDSGQDTLAAIALRDGTGTHRGNCFWGTSNWLSFGNSDACSPQVLPPEWNSGPVWPNGTTTKLPMYPPSCAIDSGPSTNPRDVARRVMTYCGKETRAQLFINSHVPENPCQAIRDVAGAYALTCIVQKEFGNLIAGGQNMPAPEIHTPADVAKMEAWLQFQAIKARKTLKSLVLQNVPNRVVTDKKQGSAGTGALQGEHGQLILQYEQGISSIVSGWLAVEAGLNTIAAAIKKVRIDLEFAQLDYQSQIGQIAMSELQVQMQMAKAAVSAAAGISQMLSTEGGGFMSVVEAGIDLEFATQTQKLLEEQKEVAKDKENETVLAALQELQTSTSQAYTNLQTSLEGLRSATLGVMSTSVALQQKQGEAQYLAAKAAGQDWVSLGTGENATFPVNAVLRRQYDLARRRYDESLRNAKYTSYVARLAIEQRIGQRLKEIDQKVGALGPPSTWADDVCTMQGCDYDALREVKPGILEPTDPQAKLDLATFADPYIGDYVKKLRNFVEYYNIEYPSHDGDDVAVLSVRDDLLGSRNQCYKEARNLLFYSYDLTGSEPNDNGQVVRGWGIEPCSLTGDKCLKVESGSVLEVATDVPELTPYAGAEGGMTWLHDVANQPYQTPNSPGGPPPHSVYQAVSLQAGVSYVLSWWDMARAADGSPTTTVPTEMYSVAVYDSNWQLVGKGYQDTPFVSTGQCTAGGAACTTSSGCCSGTCIIVSPPNGVCASEWSPRRMYPFTASTSGTYWVAISASGPGSSLGSVAISNIQLEAAGNVSAVTAYEPTSASRVVLTNDCVAGNPENFRSLFAYNCENNECYYELLEPLLIDTRLIESGETKLIGKIARGNFNYRHVTVAANVVGTGVTDCSGIPAPSCYGSAFLEYTLNHDAYSSPVIDYLGKAREFDFGSAGISRGKAIAAERFITLPIGSADSQLLQQPLVTKSEFRGRPLSGFYRLRVYDQPSLVWNNVEDIQLVLTYRYWARIARESSTQ